MNKEWLKKAEKLATEYAHVYSFVGDDTMQVAQNALFKHLALAVDNNSSSALDPHAELKAQYAIDIKTCESIDGLEAWQLIQIQEDDGTWDNVGNCFNSFVPEYKYRRHPHAELKAQYAIDVETCKTIYGLEAWQLWQYNHNNQGWWNTVLDIYWTLDKYRRHPHADLMIEYHKCSDDDKKRWQFWSEEDKQWVAVSYEYNAGKPKWCESTQYRLKRRTITINGKEYNAPMNVIPKFGEKYWSIGKKNGEFNPFGNKWEDDSFDANALKSNNCFATKEDCQAVIDAFNEILAGAK